MRRSQFSISQLCRPIENLYITTHMKHSLSCIVVFAHCYIIGNLKKYYYIYINMEQPQIIDILKDRVFLEAPNNTGVMRISTRNNK